jgi:hypothetical protein
MITEFGGITLTTATRGEVWHGYGGEPDVVAFLKRYRDLVDALLDSPSVTGFCYTQLADTEQEQNGLLTDRREPKLPMDQLRAINRRTAASVPADAIGAFDYGDYPAPLDGRIDQDQGEPPDHDDQDPERRAQRDDVTEEAVSTSQRGRLRPGDDQAVPTVEPSAHS